MRDSVIRNLRPCENFQMFGMGEARGSNTRPCQCTRATSKLRRRVIYPNLRC